MYIQLFWKINCYLKEKIPKIELAYRKKKYTITVKKLNDLKYII